MSVRLVDIIVPEYAADEACKAIALHCRRYWEVPIEGELNKFSCLVQNRYVERFLDTLNRQFGTFVGFSAVVIEIDALLPPIEESDETALPGLPPPTRLEAFFSRDRISTGELYDDLEPSLSIKPTYLVTVVLATIIAALGMRSGQVAVVIGAMVIAPLLGPTMGMALGATIGDRRLGVRATRTLAVGSLAAIGAAYLLGLMVEIEPLSTELRNRSLVQPADIALALACGAAGVLAFSQGASLSLVGVMIAVALVPPLAAAGLFLSKNMVAEGAGALLLFSLNLVCVNIAGIATFLLEGLPPRSWRLTSGIAFLWTIILVLFAAMLVGSLEFGVPKARF